MPSGRKSAKKQSKAKAKAKAAHAPSKLPPARKHPIRNDVELCKALSAYPRIARIIREYQSQAFFEADLGNKLKWSSSTLTWNFRKDRAHQASEAAYHTFFASILKPCRVIQANIEHNIPDSFLTPAVLERHLDYFVGILCALVDHWDPRKDGCRCVLWGLNRDSLRFGTSPMFEIGDNTVNTFLMMHSDSLSPDAKLSVFSRLTSALQQLRRYRPGPRSSTDALSSIQGCVTWLGGTSVEKDSHRISTAWWLLPWEMQRMFGQSTGGYGFWDHEGSSSSGSDSDEGTGHEDERERNVVITYSDLESGDYHVDANSHMYWVEKDHGMVWAS